MRRYRYLIIIFFALLISGCSGTPKLKYIPMTVDSGIDNKIAISVSEFKDVRSDRGKGTIGLVMVLPGINADVKEPTDIMKWLTEAFKLELRNAGYRVSSDRIPLILEGDLLSMTSISTLTTQGTIIMKIRLREGDKIILDKIYKGESDNADIFEVSTSTLSENALRIALQDAIKKVLADINTKLVR